MNSIGYPDGCAEGHPMKHRFAFSETAFKRFIRPQDFRVAGEWSRMPVASQDNAAIVPAQTSTIHYASQRRLATRMLLAQFKGDETAKEVMGKVKLVPIGRRI